MVELHRVALLVEFDVGLGGNGDFLLRDTERGPGKS